MPATTSPAPTHAWPPASPEQRDLPIDALRAAAVGVVVVGHAIVAAVAWRDGRPAADNLLAISGPARWMTWVFQVLPLVFLCGGVAAARSAGRPGWLAARIERLAAPATAYLAVAAAALASARATGVLDPRSTEVVGRALVMHLWFLAAFVVVTALTPALLVVGRRFGWRAVPVALLATVLVDGAARWLPLVGWLNLAVVWGLCTYLGVLRTTAHPWPGGRRGAALGAVAALAGLVALVRLGAYPVSMVGVPGATSNADPPTLALALLGLVQAGAFSALTSGWAPRRPKLIAAANRMAMGAYLWQFAGIVLAAVVLLPTGVLPSPVTGTWAWWALRPLWVVACLAAVAAVTAAVGRRATGRPSPGRPGSAVTGLAAAAAVGGFFLVTTSGITPTPGFLFGAALLALARLAARSGPSAATVRPTGASLAGSTRSSTGPARKPTPATPSSPTAT